MEALQDMLCGAMSEKKMSIRRLEASIAQELGEEHKVSRNLIHEYLSGKRAPTYEAAVAISQVLDLDKRKFLILTYVARQEQRRRSERERFLEFCRKEGIPVSARELGDWDK